MQHILEDGGQNVDLYWIITTSLYCIFEFAKGKVLHNLIKFPFYCNVNVGHASITPNFQWISGT